jgi:hypothetical protein
MAGVGEGRTTKAIGRIECGASVTPGMTARKASSVYSGAYGMDEMVPGKGGFLIIFSRCGE